MLKKSHRLTTDFEFNVTRKYGRKISSPLFNLYFLEARNYVGPAKIGIVVSNKISKNATRRNRIKRVIREVVRSKLPLFPENTWTAIFTSNKCLDATYETISTEVNQALQKIFITN